MKLTKTEIKVEPRTVFFTAAVGNYKMFALPYVFSVLAHNHDAFVEILVDDSDKFLEQSQSALELMPKDRVLFRESPTANGKEAARARFLVEPHTKTEYVYIGDVDIIILDSNITDWHVNNSKRLGLPYSNKLRACGTRLTGLHFTRRDAYYPIPDIKLPTGDETALKKLVEARWPMPSAGKRPIHGIHTCLNRENIIRSPNTVHWSLGAPEWARYKQFREDTAWPELLACMPAQYQALIRKMETVAKEELE